MALKRKQSSEFKELRRSQSRFRRNRHTLEQLEPRICLAAGPQLLGDLNSQPLSPSAGQYLAAKDFVYFTARDPQHGTELWRTDGTASGTLLVKDINVGPGNSDIALTSYQRNAPFAVDGNLLYFVANDGLHGPELWRSDGTESGTFLLKDVFPGSQGSDPNSFHFVGPTVLFAANAPESGRELWKSDGTTAGTTLVKDIFRDGDSNPSYGNELNGRLIFIAKDETHGTELWSSDGTESGTLLLKDINSTGDGTKYPCWYMSCGFPPVKHSTLNRIFFSGIADQTGAEPWVTDGTEAGTVLLRDINPMPDVSSSPAQAIPLGDSLFFLATEEDGTQGLWKSDGTRAGTTKLNGFAPGRYDASNLTAVGNLLYFTGFDSAHGAELWWSDGTSQGALRMEINPRGGAYPEPKGVLGQTFFFSADDGQTGRELWKANEQGVTQVKDINPQGSSYPTWTASAGERLVFAVRDNDGKFQVWSTDESATNVALLHEGPASNYTYSNSGISWNRQVIFTGSDGNAWRTDGTIDGTLILRNELRTQDSSPQSFVHFQGKDYFLAEDGSSWGLYVHDPSSAATERVRGFANGDGSQPHASQLQMFRDRLTFLVNGQLWISDGTKTGTKRIASTVTSLKSLRAADEVLFMTSTDSLWKSDGTEEGTVLVKGNLDGATDQIAYPQHLTTVGNTLFFSAYHARSGRELWKSDGTAQGTVVVRDIAPGDLGSDPKSLAIAGNRLFFTADDGQHGRELWTTDGATEGTELVKDLDTHEVMAGSAPGQFLRVADAVYFVAQSGNGRQALWQIRDDASDTPKLLADGLYGIDGLTDFHGRLLFAASSGGNFALWVVNESEEGVINLTDRNAFFGGDLAISGNVAFFSGQRGSGPELWKTDGTHEGTVLVSDINPGSGGSYPSSLTPLDGQLFFVARNDKSGQELWMSDGTREGTVLVKDINPGASSSYPGELRRFGQSLIFTADDGTRGRELWITDGTTEGTRLVSDLRSEVTHDSFAEQYTQLGKWTYFVATDGLHGRELWKTDGTAAGTVRVTDIQPGAADAGINSLQVVGDRLFFTAYSPRDFSQTLWMLDEVSTSAVEVRNSATDPRDFAVLNGQLYFSGMGQACCSRELYTVEVTSTGPISKRITNLFPQGSADPTHLTLVGNQLFFVADDGIHGRELWQTDGTEAGTKLVADIHNSLHTASAPGQFQQVGDLVYFTAQDAAHGTELWVTDGTIFGAHIVADIWAGPGSSSPGELIEINGKLVFSADDGAHGRELWTSDGTRAGTLQIRDIHTPYDNSSNPQSLTNVGGTLFFFAENSSGPELWRSDGTRQGTVTVKNINTASRTGAITLPDQIVAIDTTVYFVADDGTHGRELWKSDGTRDGTVMVKDLRPGERGSIADSAALHKLVALGSRLYFAADADGSRGAELWVSDGTDAGTVMVFDPGVSHRGLLPLDAVGDWLYFSARSDEHGRELWRTDGTTENTSLVADLSPGGSSTTFVRDAEFTQLGPDKILFPAITASSGRELWVTDGTAEGTVPLDLEPGAGSTDFGVKIQTRTVGEVAYFFAATQARGSGLWKTDGTLAGTELILPMPLDPWPDLAAINNELFFGVANEAGNLGRYVDNSATYLPLAAPDPSVSSFPAELTAVGDQLYFVAEDGVHGRELWTSDGTANGTQLVADIVRGTRSAFPTALMSVGSRLYFSASDDEAGTELWTTMGSSESTTRVRDINPGVGGSYPTSLTSWSGQLVFSASEPNTGLELWISDGTEEGTKLLSDSTPGSASSDPTGAVVFNERLFVVSRADSGEKLLWRYDSPDAEPLLVTSSPVTSTPMVAGDRLYFSAHDPDFGIEPWISDGTTTGTHPLADVNSTSPGSSPRLLTTLGDTVYFVANYGQQAELWQTDGTSEGTRRVVELIPDLTMGAPTSLLVAGDGFYLTQSGTSGTELWKADPKVSRAELLWDSSKGSFRNPLLVLSDRRLFFTATDDDHGTELWVTDGTADGTHLVRDINRGNESTFISSSPDFQREWLQEYLGGLLFVAAEPSRGTELWFTDGTDAGTYPVADVRPGPAGSGIGSLYVSRDIIYFSANDGLHGFEPWVSDGSSRGTRMLANVDARTYGSDPAWPTRSGSDLFFAATASDGERRLWRWNPTTDSAAVVSEAVLNPTDLVDVDGTLYFSAFHPEYGRELWQTDGTAAGTRLVVDLVPGPSGSSPGNIAALNGDIYFSAVDEVHGREPWWLPALPGDANGDRQVDFADFADLASSFGGLGTRRDGDFNGDGMIDFEDFVILATNFG